MKGKRGAKTFEGIKESCPELRRDSSWSTLQPHPSPFGPATPPSFQASSSH